MVKNMHIIENQMICYSSVLSYWTRVNLEELAELIKFAQKNIDAMDLKITGDIIFSINEKICENDKTILGIELLIPIDKQFDSNCHYVFKPKFVIKNALFTKYSGAACNLKNAERELLQYAFINELSLITKAYYVVRQVNYDVLTIDVYVGISENKL